MSAFVTVIHLLSCFFLIVVILLQAGKGAGMGILGSTGQTVFGGRGAANFLSKLTTGIAGLFVLTSLFLAWSSSRTEDTRLKQRAEQTKQEKITKANALKAETEAKAALTGRPDGQSTAPASASPSNDDIDTPSPKKAEKPTLDDQAQKAIDGTKNAEGNPQKEATTATDNAVKALEEEIKAKAAETAKPKP